MVKYLDIKLGYECNNNCRHCVIALQREKTIDIRGNYNRYTNECCDEILKSKNKGYNSVVITGGEPLIRNDILEILKYAKDIGLKIFMQSNGRLLNDNSFALNVNSYVDAYTIALHGSCSFIHDKITEAEESFNETVAGLRNLVDLNAKIFIKTVISNYNYTDLLNIIKLIDRLGIKKINLAFPHANGNAAKYFKEVVPTYHKIKSYIEECIIYCKNNNIDLELESILPCALDKTFDLKYFADLKQYKYECELKQLDSEELDWNIIRKEIKRKNKICNKCILSNRCEGYWMEYVEIHGFDEFQPITENI